MGITIGDAHYDNSEDAMCECDCGHRALLSQVEEVWYGGTVTLICDACLYRLYVEWVEGEEEER